MMIRTAKNDGANLIKSLILRLWRCGLYALYTRFAWTYDAVACLVSRGRWQAWGRAAIPFLQGRRVLELGHGPGHLLASLLDAGFDPVGIDLSNAMSYKAKRNLLKRDGANRLVRGRVQQLGLANETFDSVVSVFPSEYILDDATLQEIYRVLSPEGILVLVPVAQFTGKPSQDQESPVNASGLINLLKAAGFSSDARWVKLSSSRVMVIVLQKIAQSGIQVYH
ncbi:MAG: class I SAM-dependent methyltransferase [Anaerolineales bacterium]|nr:class I SAM-dependent methyltransferase [Anaerolineales bacterium]